MVQINRLQQSDFSCLLRFTVQVKADKDSANLHRLQQASRGVTQATAQLVASTKSGKSQIEETGKMRFQSLPMPSTLWVFNPLRDIITQGREMASLSVFTPTLIKSLLEISH